MKCVRKRIAYLSILSLAILSYIASDSFRSWITHILLLFSSHSKEQMAGTLHTASFPSLSSLGLYVFQSLLPTFDYRPLLFANLHVFGAAKGWLLTFLGRVAGAALCYDIARTFCASLICKVRKGVLASLSLSTEKRETVLTHILFRLVPLPFDIANYSGGCLFTNRKYYLGITASWVALDTSLYFLRNGYFPVSWEKAFFVARLGLLIASLLILFLTKRHRASRSESEYTL